MQNISGVKEFITLLKMTFIQLNKVYMFYDRVCIKMRIGNTVFCFQANFYVEDSSRQSSTQPPPCNLCDGVHDASYQCHKCQRNLCAECRRYHDKLCMGSQVTELQQASSFSSSSMGVEGASHSTVKQQLQKVEDVMKKLTEEEKEVNQERRLVESDINDRYATLLRHVNEARDVCLTSLRETCQGVTDRLQSHMTRAKQAQDTLTQQLSCPQPAPISVPQLNTALFLGGDLQTVLNTDSDRKGSVLHQEMKDNTEMLVSCIQSFIGRVVESGQAATGVQSKSSAPELGILGNRGSSASAEPSLISAGGGDLQSMQQRLDDVANQVKQLSLLYSLLSDSSSSKISTVEKELAAMKDKMASDQTTVLRELTALQEKNTKLMADQAVVQREVKTLRDKNTIALQDLSVMSSEKDQLHAEVSKLQQDIISMQTDSSMLQTDVIQLKTDRDSVMTDVKTALNDITALQGDVNTAKNDIKKVEAGQATVKSDMNTFQSDVKALQGDITTAKNDLTTLKTDHSSLRSDVSSAQKDITALQGDSSTLKSDVKSSKSQLTSLQQSVRSAQDSLRDRTSKITALETCLSKWLEQSLYSSVIMEEKKKKPICLYSVKKITYEGNSEKAREGGRGGGGERERERGTVNIYLCWSLT